MSAIDISHDFKTTNGLFSVRKSDIECYRGTSEGCVFYMKNSEQPVFVNENFDFVDNIFNL